MFFGHDFASALKTFTSKNVLLKRVSHSPFALFSNRYDNTRRGLKPCFFFSKIKLFTVIWFPWVPLGAPGFPMGPLGVRHTPLGAFRVAARQSRV